MRRWHWRRGAVLILVATLASGTVPARAEAPAALLLYDMLPVGPGGSPVFVGTAEPGATLELLDGATVLATGIANERGEWILAPNAPLSAGAHDFSVRATPPAAAGVTPDPASALPPPPASPPAVPAPPFSARLDPTGAPTLIRGTGTPNAVVEVAFIGGPAAVEVRADAAGVWAAPIPPLVAGAYPVRATELDRNGVTAATAEFIYVVPLAAGTLQAVVAITPAPRSEAAATLAGPRLVTVGRNDTLWDIAVRAYGDGTRYREIYDANRDQLSSPRRIFAGQVLLIP